MTDPEKQAETRATAFSLLWLPEESQRRGPKRAMSLTKIVEAAIAIADESGLEPVSMGAVARHLGFTPMALYRYISSKDDLLTLMMDAGFGAPPVTILAASGWRDACVRWSSEIRVRYQIHPWLLDVPINGPPITPNQLQWLESFLEGVSGGGLSDGDALGSALLLSGYVLSVSRLDRDIARNPANAGSQPEENYRNLLPLLQQAGTYPRLSGLIQAGGFAESEEDIEFGFGFGLERILDGIEVLVSPT